LQGTYLRAFPDAVTTGSKAFFEDDRCLSHAHRSQTRRSTTATHAGGHALARAPRHGFVALGELGEVLRHRGVGRERIRHVLEVVGGGCGSHARVKPRRRAHECDAGAPTLVPQVGRTARRRSCLSSRPPLSHVSSTHWRRNSRPNRRRWSSSIHLARSGSRRRVGEQRASDHVRHTRFTTVSCRGEGVADHGGLSTSATGKQEQVQEHGQDLLEPCCGRMCGDTRTWTWTTVASHYVSEDSSDVAWLGSERTSNPATLA